MVQTVGYNQFSLSPPPITHSLSTPSLRQSNDIDIEPVLPMNEAVEVCYPNDCIILCSVHTFMYVALYHVEHVQAAQSCSRNNMHSPVYMYVDMLCTASLVQFIASPHLECSNQIPRL